MITKGCTGIYGAANHIELQPLIALPEHFPQGMSVAVQTKDYSQKQRGKIFRHIEAPEQKKINLATILLFSQSISAGFELKSNEKKNSTPIFSILLN